MPSFMFTLHQAALVLLRIVSVLAMVAVSSPTVQAATASWDPNSEPDIGGYYLSYGTQSGAYTVTIDVGNVTAYTFNPAAGMRYYVVVQAYSTTGALSAKSAEVTLDVPLPNRAPVLTQPANQTSVVDAVVSLPLSASDPDGMALRFWASGLPPGLSIDSSSGIISGIALAKGWYVVHITVTDGSLWAYRGFTWTVIDNAAIVVDLSPLDTTLMMNTENTSAADWLATYTWPANGVAAAILMKFNLAQLPANALVRSAVLHMFLTMTDGNGDEPNYTVSLHQVVNRNPDIARATGYAPNTFSTWTANQCCVNGVPMAQADISPARAATVVNRTLGFKTWDATTLAQTWLSSPASNYGLLLNADTSRSSHRFRLFGSMQDTVPARRPFLRVTYTVPADTTTVVAAMANATPEEDSYLRVSGDFDGDGRPDMGTYRASAGEWRIWTSRSNFTAPILAVWGITGDVPVPADYDGDTVTDVATYRPSTGDWHIWLSKTQEPLLVHWGAAGDRPVAVDVDGDGKADLAVLRAGIYEVLLSRANYSTTARVQ